MRCSRAAGTRSWIQRLVIGGKRCELGFGSVALVSLAEAREKAVANRKLAREGGDPLADKRRLQSMPTFTEAAAAVVEQKQAGRTPSSPGPSAAGSDATPFRASARGPCRRSRAPTVLAVLSPIWHAKAVIARAVPQRLHAVLEWAIAMNLRNDNSADRVRPVLGP